VPVLAVLGSLLVSGCTDDPEPGPSGTPTTPTADSATTSVVPVDPDTVESELAAVFAGDHSGKNARSEGRCFAQNLLSAIDAEALRDAGVVGADGHVVDPVPVLDVAVAERWVDAQEACIDFITASTRALTAQSKGKLDGVAYQACLRAALTPDAVRAALVSALSGGLTSPEVEALTDAQDTCAGEALPED